LEWFSAVCFRVFQEEANAAVFYISHWLSQPATFRETTKSVSAFGLSHNQIAMVGVDSSLSV